MKSLTLLIKPASSQCNLRCRYCFYEDEAQNRSQHSMGVMTEELADLLIRQAFDAVDADGAVSFAFQGGEPTVAGLPFFRHFVSEVKASKPPAVKVGFSVQTNGTLLNEDWAAFFHENGFLVGLSLDGFRAAHNAYRVDVSGEGTWKRVLAAKTLLGRHGVSCNALCVVTRDCAESPELAYRRLKNFGFRFLQFIACMDPIGHARGQEPYSLTPEQYGQFLCEVFDLWYRDWAAGDYHSVRIFDDYIHILLGDGASTCAACGKCGSYLVIEGDGSVYPCDFYVLDHWKIGDITETPLSEMAAGRKAADFLSSGADKPNECLACTYRKICNGGCKNDWYADSDGNHNYYCRAFKTLLDYAMPRMKQIAQAELAARKERG